MRERDRQTDRQIDRQTDRHWERQAGRQTETVIEGQSPKNPSITLLFYRNICLCFCYAVWAISLGPTAQLHNLLATVVCKITGYACLRGCSNRTHQFFPAEPT